MLEVSSGGDAVYWMLQYDGMNGDYDGYAVEIYPSDYGVDYENLNKGEANTTTDSADVIDSIEMSGIVKKSVAAVGDKDENYY
jgi:hypothetical protein